MPITKDNITSALSLIDCISISATDHVYDDLANRINHSNQGQKQHYQDSWSRIEKKFDLVRETAGDLNELLEKVNGIPYSNGIVSNDVAGNQIRINIANFQQTDGHMVIINNGQYEMVPNADATDTRLVDVIVDTLNANTQAVVELGCGWGRNLASIALTTDRRDMAFIGLEQSASGLKCTEELLSKDPTIQHITNHFDFYSPDFSNLKTFDNVIVFSCAAIEQIAFIGTDFIDQVMSIGENVTLILYEPIGWQRVRELQEFGVMTAIMEIMGKIPPEQHHIENYDFELLNTAVLANAVSWSIGGRYNLNLWSVVQDAVSRQLVNMSRSEFDISGMNPFNPYSLIVLEKRK